MRLIDADKFKQQIAAITVMNGYDAEVANKICKIIDSQPTVVKEETGVEILSERTD